MEAAACLAVAHAKAGSGGRVICALAVATALCAVFIAAWQSPREVGGGLLRPQLPACHAVVRRREVTPSCLARRRFGRGSRRSFLDTPACHAEGT